MTAEDFCGYIDCRMIEHGLDGAAMTPRVRAKIENWTRSFELMHGVFVRVLIDMSDGRYAVQIEEKRDACEA